MKDSQSSLESRRQRSGTHSSLGVATGIYLHLGRRSRADLSQKSFTQNPPGVPRTGQEHIWVKSFSLKSSKGTGYRIQRKDRFESKAFHSNPAGVEGAHLNQKLLLDYRVQGKEKRRGRPLFLFLLGSTFFFWQYLKNVQCSMQNENPLKLQSSRHFTLNPNGYRMTTMMTGEFFRSHPQ